MNQPRSREVSPLARGFTSRVRSIWVLPKKGQSPANSSHEAEPRASGGT